MSNFEPAISFESIRPHSLDLCALRCLGGVCVLQTYLDGFQVLVQQTKNQPDNEALDQLAQTTYSGLQAACQKFNDASVVAEHVEQHGEPA